MRPIRLLATAAMAALALLAPDVARACTVSAAGVSFGNYDTLSPAPDDGIGSVSVTCHPHVHFADVGLTAGQSLNYSARTMRNGAASLSYNLYTDAARTTVWGDGVVVPSVTVNPGSVNSGTRTIVRTIYGRIPAQQSVPFGTYSDTIIVTITF
jgi:spore coat protein U-like protein